MKPSHTPGPWKIETYCGPLFGIVRELKPNETPEPRTRADANLISAAPDMLAALEEFIRCGPYAGQNRDLLELVESTIKKARGE